MKIIPNQSQVVSVLEAFEPLASFGNFDFYIQRILHTAFGTHIWQSFYHKSISDFEKFRAEFNDIGVKFNIVLLEDNGEYYIVNLSGIQDFIEKNQKFLEYNKIDLKQSTLDIYYQIMAHTNPYFFHIVHGLWTGIEIPEIAEYFCGNRRQGENLVQIGDCYHFVGVQKLHAFESIIDRLFSQTIKNHLLKF